MKMKFKFKDEIVSHIKKQHLCDGKGELNDSSNLSSPACSCSLMDQSIRL